MRKVVVYELVSLDGVAEAPERFFDDWDEIVDANLAAVIAPQDDVVLGRRSYDEWSRYWPTSDIEPFATFINGVKKHVATSTPLDGRWSGAVRIDRDLSDFVRGLKQSDGGDIGIHASIELTRSLLPTGVVDELRLVIAPRIVGDGRRLFDGLPSIHLETVETETSPSGYLIARYRMAPDTTP